MRQFDRALVNRTLVTVAKGLAELTIFYLSYSQMCQVRSGFRVHPKTDAPFVGFNANIFNIRILRCQLRFHFFMTFPLSWATFLKANFILATDNTMVWY